MKPPDRKPSHDPVAAISVRRYVPPPVEMCTIMDEVRCELAWIERMLSDLNGRLSCAVVHTVAQPSEEQRIWQQTC